MRKVVTGILLAVALELMIRTLKQQLRGVHFSPLTFVGAICFLAAIANYINKPVITYVAIHAESGKASGSVCCPPVCLSVCLSVCPILRIVELSRQGAATAWMCHHGMSELNVGWIQGGYGFARP